MTGEWGQAVTNRIAARIKDLRGDRSAQWIEDRTSELGHRISRATVWELESGQRKTITLQDLLMLAAALGVKVADLLYPDNGEIEVLPGVELPRYEALYQLVDMSASRERLLEAYVAIRDDFINLGLSLTGQEPEQSWARLMTPEEVRTGRREPSVPSAETAAGDPASIAKDFFEDTSISATVLPSTTNAETGDGR